MPVRFCSTRFVLVRVEDWRKSTRLTLKVVTVSVLKSFTNNANQSNILEEFQDLMFIRCL